MLPFNKSKAFSLGIELEIQLVDRDSKDLISVSNDVLKHLVNTPYGKNIKPEVTKSMIEINSSIHDTPHTLLSELNQIKDQLLEQSQDLNMFFSGGGTHPFQLWQERELYPTPHYLWLERKYGYLTKMFTVFGMHIHIGCTNPNDALYLTHAMAKYIPHLIALSASSPFCQGIDTDFASSRSNTVNLFPVSGMPPFILDWPDFCAYLNKMKKLSLIDHVDNFYWDIRPRDEFGTIEIRVCDMPLSLEKSVQITAFAQSLAHYLLNEKPFTLSDDLYELHPYNRFQASKLGYDAYLVDPTTFKEYPLFHDLIDLCKKLEPHSKVLNNETFMAQLTLDILEKKNDASWLRNLFVTGESLKDIVYLAGHLFSGNIHSDARA